MFRVGKALEPEALSRPGARPMEMKGRAMPGMVCVEVDQALDAGLDRFVCALCRQPCAEMSG